MYFIIFSKKIAVWLTLLVELNKLFLAKNKNLIIRLQLLHSKAPPILKVSILKDINVSVFWNELKGRKVERACNKTTMSVLQILSHTDITPIWKSWLHIYTDSRKKTKFTHRLLKENTKQRYSLSPLSGNSVYTKESLPNFGYHWPQSKFKQKSKNIQFLAQIKTSNH